VTKHRITIELFHCVDAGTGRVDNKRRVSLHWHAHRAAFDFLRRTVRGYRGPKHPWISEKYARKVQALATATGFSVEVKEKPPTPAEGKAIQRKAIAFMREHMRAYEASHAE
jgi:hypothetical protein